MNPLLSVVIPAHNEEECIESTLEDLCKILEKETIDYEVIVSNDHSTDSTGRILDDLCMKNPRIKHIENTKPNGFGFAVRAGFEQANGEWIAVMMADASDDPRDLINFYLEGLQKETDAVFGYKGKQVRDNIHSHDLVNMFWQFYLKPRIGEVYNAGGSRHSNCSMLEAINICEELSGREMKWTYEENNRVGDHIWWISDVRKFKSHFPEWEYRYGIREILEEIVEAQMVRK